MASFNLIFGSDWLPPSGDVISFTGVTGFDLEGVRENDNVN
jgi:hypothetical protein